MNEIEEWRGSWRGGVAHYMHRKAGEATEIAGGGYQNRKEGGRRKEGEDRARGKNVISQLFSHLLCPK